MGTGGVGGYYGGMLARAGEDVTLIARGTHLEVMRSSGLTLKTTHAGEFNIPVKATDDPDEIGTVDLVIFCVKTYDTDTAARIILPIIGPQTVIMSLQNGVENEARIAGVVGKKHVIGAAAYISSVIEAPGVINQSWVLKVYLGELSGKPSSRTEQLVKAFERAGVAAEIPPDIHVAMWSKLLRISAFAGVGCVTRLPSETILSCPETTSLFWGVVEEGYAVARAGGIDMPDDFIDQFRGIIATLAPTLRPSMYYDLEAGRRLELEELIGTVIHLGEKHKVATPLSFAIYAALKPYVNGFPVLPDA
jgi:2-dehydropantoate 2-reductase